MFISMLMLLLSICVYQVTSTVQISVENLYTTISVFKVTVNVENEEEVYLSSNVTLVGDLQKSSSEVNSAIVFDKLMVTSSGFVEISAKGSTSGEIATYVTNVEEPKQEILIKLSTDVVVAYDMFELRIYVTDQYKSAWVKNTTLYINNGIENYEVFTSNGFHARKITYRNIGNYNISVISSDGGVYIKEIEVKNLVKKISTYFNDESVTAKFPALLTIKIYGKDGNLYGDPANINITYQSGKSKTKKKKILVENGFKELEIYFEDYSDNASCTAIYGYLSTYKSSSSFIKVNPNKIVLSHKEGWIPKYKKDSFKFDIKIMDYNETKLESTYGMYNLSFELLPYDLRLGGSQKTVTTKDGQVKIDDLYLISTGTYRLKILCDSCETYITEEFEIESDTCEFSIVTLCVLGVLVFLLIFCSLVLHLADKNTLQNPKGREENNRINWLFHPFISLLFRQPSERRLINSIQLFLSELTILTLIGLFYFYYDNPTEKNDSSFTGFYGRQVYKGATGWTCAQFIGFPLFIFKVHSVLNPNKRTYYYVTCIILALINISLVIWMSCIFCKGYIMFWTVNFLIFVIIDLVLIQGVLTISAGCFKPEINEKIETNEKKKINRRNEKNPIDPNSTIINQEKQGYDTIPKK